jgi:hypothetical protein
MRKYSILAILLAFLLGSAHSLPASAEDKPDPAAGAKTGASSCKLPDKASAQDFVVTLNSDTLWRPRNASVRFTVQNNTAPCKQITAVKVNFQWRKNDSPPKTDDTATAQCTTELLKPKASPLVRSVSSNNGVAEYEAVVPNLSDVCASWFARMAGNSEVASVGLYSVPLADMAVEISVTGDTDAVNIPVPVGVTSVAAAVMFVIVALALFFATAWLILKDKPPAGWLAGAGPKPSLPLRIVTTIDGYGSLSQFQIILWTLVVGASAVYVIVLSGNLINITDGILTLLGIAGGTAVLGRIPVKPDKVQAPGAAPPAAPAAPVLPVPAPAAAVDPAAVAAPADGAAVPPLEVPDPPADAAAPPAAHTTSWSDLVMDGDDGIDVTRIQMLVFTMITAVFVALKVIVGYAIPEIPANFLVLMGISNGVYISGKHLPDKGKKPGGSSGPSA